MALPTFTRDVNPPSVAYLLSQYPTPVALNDTTSSIPVNQGSNVDVTNMLMNHDVQFQMWQKQRQQQMQQTSESQWGAGEMVVPSIKMSVDDAFGDMPEVEDRPLPSLEYAVQEEVAVEDQVDDDFGDFDAAQSEQVSDDVIASDDCVTFDHGSGDFLPTDFGAGMECPNNPMSAAISDHTFNSSLPNMGHDSAAINIGHDDGNSFGGFNTTTNQSSESFFPGNSNEFGSFEDSNPLSGSIGDELTKNNGNIQSHSQNENVDDSNHPQLNNHGHTLSISDAFDSLVPDPDMSSVPISQTDKAHQLEPTANYDNNMAAEEEDFGEFEGTQEHSESIGADHNIGQTDAIGGYNYSQSNHNGPTLSISDAFESMVPDPDMSSVPTNQMGEPNDLKSAENQDNSPEEDCADFGGFESTPIISTDDYNTGTYSQTEALDDDNFNKSHGPTLSISDAFESMVPNPDMSSVPMNQMSQPNESESMVSQGNIVSAEEEDFGGFESTPATSAQVHADDFNIDGQYKTESLDSHNVDGYSAAAEQSEDFGNFESTPATSAQLHAYDFNKDSQYEVEALDVNDINEPNHHVPTLSISDTFESMVPDPVIPSILISQMDETNEFEPTASYGNNAACKNEDFDESESTHNQSKSTSIEQDKNDFNTESISQAKTSDALNAGGPGQEAPPLITNVKSAEIFVVDEKKLSEDVNFNQDPKPEIDEESSYPAFGNTGVATSNQFGLSAFDDIFGGAEDAPLPPLEAFSPAVENGVKIENTEDESDFNESFGDFEGNMTIAESSPHAEMADDIVPTADAKFGGSETISQPSNPTAEASPQETEYQYLDTPIHAAQLSKPELTDFESSFGDFEGSHQLETIPNSQVEKHQNDTHDDDLGGFSAFDSSTGSNIVHTQNESGASETQNSQAEFDETFGDFEEGNNVCTESDPEIIVAVNDDFGGFDSTPDQPTETLDEDNFGDFAAFESTNTEGNEIKALSSKQLPESDATQHGRTDNFSEFAGMGSSSISNGNHIIQDCNPVTQVHHIEHSTNIPSNDILHGGNDNNFGGFAAFDSQASTNLTHHKDELEATTIEQADDNIHNKDNGDDFGGFATFDSQATSNKTHSESESGAKKQGEDGQNLDNDDEFGEFAAFDSNDNVEIQDENLSPKHDSEANTNGQTDEVNAESNQDDFGGFATFDSSINDTQNDNTVTQNENDEPETSTYSQADGILSNDHDDNFGDFATFDSAIQDDFKAPHNNHIEVTTEPDDFGAFIAFNGSNKNTTDTEFGDFDEFGSAPAKKNDESSQPYNDLREKIYALKQFQAPLPSKEAIISRFDECLSKRQVRYLLKLHLLFYLC